MQLTLSPRALAAFSTLAGAIQELRDKPLAYSAFDPTGFKEEAETLRKIAGLFAEAVKTYVSVGGNCLADDIERLVEHTAIDLESAAEDFANDPWKGDDL